MPGRDRILDPISRDYVADGKGGYQKTTTLRTAIHHQLLDELGNWVGDPEAGSTLHEFGRAKNSEAQALRAAEAVRVALQRFVDQGLAKDLDVTVERSVEGRWVIRSSITDIQHNETIDLSDLLSFGA